MKERIKLAKDIEKAQHLVKKENHDRNWLKEAAEAMDVDIDPSLLVFRPHLLSTDSPFVSCSMATSDKADTGAGCPIPMTLIYPISVRRILDQERPSTQKR